MKIDQASDTAFKVAQGILYRSLRADSRTMVPAEMQQALYKILGASDEGRAKLTQLRNPLFRSMVPLVERLLIPGITLHYVLRKRYIEDYVRQQLAAGITQVVNLGAGFDTLCYRLAQEFPEINFIEVDHPATRRLKWKALEGEAVIGANLALVGVDFTEQTLEGELAPNH